MVFSSFVFLAVFMPVFLIVYLAVPAKHIKIKNAVLLIFSLFFYAWGEPKWIIALIFSTLWDYLIGLSIPKYRGRWQSKMLLGLSMCGNLGLLVVFKYGVFFLDTVGIETAFAPALPVGISFYTFQTMSYTIDLYRGRVEPQRDAIAFFAYVTMFPQLVAGPIVRYTDIEKKLLSRQISFQKFSEGVTRFASGLGKKVIFANYAGKIASELLAADIRHISTAGVWFGALMFMFQIYFDFSGYSDMAIGLGKMIGFDFKENFDHPYISKSITEFWRRWHISLGSFFKDYLYIPLGGNRKRAVPNLLIVWFLTGLWHGASYNFILWGMYFGFILLVEKYALKNFFEKIPKVFAHLYSLTAILFGWLIFYFTDLNQLAAFSASFWGFGTRLTDYRTTELFLSNILILPVLALFTTELPAKAMARLKKILPPLEPLINFALICSSFIMLMGQTYNPFLYFRF